LTGFAKIKSDIKLYKVYTIFKIFFKPENPIELLFKDYFEPIVLILMAYILISFVI